MSVRQPSWILWSTLPAVLLVVAFGLWVRVNISGPTTVDQDWLNLVGLEPDTTGYWLAVTIAEVGGGPGAVICTGLLAAVFVRLQRFRAVGVLATTMLMGIALSELLKAVVTRVRPSEQLYDSLGFSYPSGHSMGAAALNEVEAVPTEITPPLEPVRLRFHWSMILALAWILLMKWSRTALQVHWLSDTIAGALIGISAAVLADELWTWVTIRTRSPHRER